VNKPNAEIDLKEINLILLNSKKLILSIVLFFVFASGYYLTNLKPSYLSEATLQIGRTNSFEQMQTAEDLIQYIENEFPIIHATYPENSQNGKLVTIKNLAKSEIDARSNLEKGINFVLKHHQALIDIEDQEIELIIKKQNQNNPIYSRFGSNSKMTKVISEVIITERKLSFSKYIFFSSFGGFLIAIFFVLIRNVSIYNNPNRG